VTLTPGQQAVVQAGSLVVSGTGKEGYEVFDDSGKDRLTYERPRTRSPSSCRDIHVILNASRQRVTVSPGQQAVVQAGSLGRIRSRQAGVRVSTTPERTGYLRTAHEFGHRNPAGDIHRSAQRVAPASDGEAGRAGCG